MPFQREAPRERAKPGTTWDLQWYCVYPATGVLQVHLIELDEDGRSTGLSETRKSQLMGPNGPRFEPGYYADTKALIWRIVQEDHADLIGAGSVV